MAQAIPQQHPAVVLRSHYRLVRALLAVAMVAIVSLAIAVAILATDDNGGGSSDAVQPAVAAPAAQTAAPATNGSTRFDGGPEEGTRGAHVVVAPSTRFDGGPEEGSAGH